MSLSEQAPAYGETGHYDRYHRHEFDEDVERRTGGVFEGIAYGIAYNGCFVYLAAFAAEMSFFDVFLRVIPCTARVGHEDSQNEAGREATDKQTKNTGDTENETGNDGGYDCQNRGEYHFALGAFGGNLYAACVIGFGFTFEDTLYLAELAAYLVYHVRCGATYGIHCKTAEQEGHHRADKHTGKNFGTHQIHFVESHEV